MSKRILNGDFKLDWKNWKAYDEEEITEEAATYAARDSLLCKLLADRMINNAK